MSTFYLWCPKADGTQHRSCITDQEALKPWGRSLPTEQEIEAWLLRDLGALYDTPDQLLRQWYYDNTDPLRVTACHFDRVPADGDINDRIWPLHIQAHGTIGTWGWGPDAKPDIKRMYRCSVHGEPPSKIYIRNHAWLRLWQPIQDAHFKYVSRELNEAQIRQRFGRHYEALRLRGRIPYGAKWLRYLAPRRVITTTHDLW